MESMIKGLWKKKTWRFSVASRKDQFVSETQSTQLLLKNHYIYQRDYVTGFVVRLLVNRITPHFAFFI